MIIKCTFSNTGKIIQILEKGNNAEAVKFNKLMQMRHSNSYKTIMR